MKCRALGSKSGMAEMLATINGWNTQLQLPERSYGEKWQWYPTHRLFQDFRPWRHSARPGDLYCARFETRRRTN